VYMSRLQVCRKFHVDLWGELLLTKKKNFKRLIFSVYQHYEKSSKSFFLRVDKLQPKKMRKPLSKFAAQKVDKDKLSAFYDFSVKKFRVVIKRAKHLRGNVFQRLLYFFEGQLCVFLYRSHICTTVPHAKLLINKLSNILVNNNLIKNPKPGFHLVPYDFLVLNDIETKTIALTYKLNVGTCRLRERHLEFDYDILAFLFMPIDLSLLLFYFPANFENAFFTPRYH
jgi:ribosomal protein S4